MTISFETPPHWRVKARAKGGTAGRGSVSGATGEFLLRSLIGRIIRTGTLHLSMPSGRMHKLGTGAPSVAVRLTTPAVVWRLLRNPELALGEAYMDGTLLLDQGSIFDLLDLVGANLKWGSGPGTMRLQSLLRKAMRRFDQNNPVSRARKNVAHHYDLPDALYELFLDPARQYSCAYYTTPSDALDQAQAQKMRHIAAKLLLRPGEQGSLP